MVSLSFVAAAGSANANTIAVPARSPKNLRIRVSLFRVATGAESLMA